jgi:hypothetical protein
MIGVIGQWVLDMDCLELVVLFSVSYFSRRKVAIGTVFLDGLVDCVFSVSGSLSWWYDCDLPTLLSTICILFRYHVHTSTPSRRFSSDKSPLML